MIKNKIKSNKKLIKFFFSGNFPREQEDINFNAEGKFLVTPEKDSQINIWETDA